MTTVADLIQDTKRLLQGSYKAQLNQLSGVVLATDTTWTFKWTLQGIGNGNYLAVDDEVVLVWQNDPAGSTATVQRGMLGTTPADHADQSIVEASPRFPQPFIRRALQREIVSWPQSVYGVGAVTLTTGANVLSTDAIGIPSNFTGILQILKKPDLLAANVVVDGQLLDPFRSSWAELGYRIERNQNRADFASGTAIFLEKMRFQGMTIRVVYSMPFDTTDMNDGVSVEDDIGLSDSMLDIPAYGVAWRLLTSSEVNRSSTFAQGEARAAQDVPLGGTIRDAGGFKQMRDSRLTEEAMRLLNSYPWRKVA